MILLGDSPTKQSPTGETKKPTQGKRRFLSDLKSAHVTTKATKLDDRFDQRRHSPTKIQETNLKSKFMDYMTERSEKEAQDLMKHMSFFLQKRTQLERVTQGRKDVTTTSAATAAAAGEAKGPIRSASFSKSSSVGNVKGIVKQFRRTTDTVGQTGADDQHVPSRKAPVKCIDPKKSPGSVFVGMTKKAGNVSTATTIATATVRKKKEVCGKAADVPSLGKERTHGNKARVILPVRTSQVHNSHKETTDGRQVGRVAGKQNQAGDRGRKPSEIPLRKSRVDKTSRQSLGDPDSTPYADAYNSFAHRIHNKFNVFKKCGREVCQRDGDQGADAVDVVDAIPTPVVQAPEVAPPAEGKITEVAYTRTETALEDSSDPMRALTFELIEKSSSSSCKAKVLDLEKVRSSSLTQLVSMGSMQMLETFHQQTVTMKETGFPDLVSNSARLRKLSSKSSIGSVKNIPSKKSIPSSREEDTKSGASFVSAVETTEPTTPKKKKVTNVVSDQPRVVSRESTLSRMSVKSSEKDPGRECKPPTGRQRQSKSRDGSKKTVLSKLRHEKGLGGNSRPTTADSESSISMCGILNCLRTPNRVKNKDGNVKPSSTEGDNTESNTEEPSLTLTIVPQVPETVSEPERKPNESVSGTLKTSRSQSLLVVGVPIKEYIESKEPPVQTIPSGDTEDNQQPKSESSEKVKLEITIDLKNGDDVADQVEQGLGQVDNSDKESEAGTVTQVASDKNKGETGEKGSAGESPAVQIADSTDSVKVKSCKSSNAIKKKLKYKNSQSKLGTRTTKKKKVKADVGETGLTTQAGHFNSFTTLQKRARADGKVRNGVPTRGQAVHGGEIGFLAEDVAALSLRRRNSEPNSFRGFIWKQPDLAVFKGNKASASSLASSLRHMNADELEDFRVWEAAPMKMTSCWEMSLYHSRRPWSMLSCSVFKDNRLANTPGSILENLRRGGTLNVSGSTIYCEKDKLQSSIGTPYDIEPSIVQKNIDIRNWLSALNFQAPMSTSNNAITDGSNYSSGASDRNQNLVRSRKALRDSNRSEDDVRKKFEDTRSWVMSQEDHWMDIAQRKSGGFVAVESTGTRRDGYPYLRLYTNDQLSEPELEEFTEVYAIQDVTGDCTEVNEVQEELQTDDEDEPGDDFLAELEKGDPLDVEIDDSPQVTQVIEDVKPRSGFKWALVRFIRGEGFINIWKYLFILSVGFILYTCYNKFIEL